MPSVPGDVCLAAEVRELGKINPAGAAASHCLTCEDSSHLLISWAASLI